MIGIVKLL